MQESFNQSDIKLIRSKITRSYFQLGGIYLPFFFALLYVYYVKDRLERRLPKDVSDSNFNLVFYIVIFFFFIIFFFFFLRDYRRKVNPYRKEMQAGAKNISTFSARKYFDPIYNQCLLYHPTKENTYILLSEYEYNSISEGQELTLESGVNTGIVLAIKINDNILSDVEEFKFSQQ